MKIGNTNRALFVICLAVFFFLKVDAFAQQEVSGTVYDGNSDKTLPGVNILVKGTTNGTTTDAQGHYSLTASASDTLVFSFVGYTTKEVAVNGRSQIDVRLSQTTYSSKDVVVVGYGTQRKEDVTSAVASVSSGDFVESAPKDAASLIKGKVAGLMITEPSGNPTSGSSIKLRGTTTLEASSEPLVLIDGVPGDLSTVAPENIAKISVLKGGSAAAIYGSRGSNGVILITTKHHKANQPATISYQGYLDVQQIKKTPGFLDAAGVRKMNKKYNAGFIDYGYNTDWIHHVLRDQAPLTQEHNLTYSAGDAQTNYTASVNFRQEDGIFKRSDNKKLVGRLNVHHSMFDGKVIGDLNFLSSIQDYPTVWNNYIWRQAFIRNPTDHIYTKDGGYQTRPQFNYDNPMSLLNEATGQNEERQMRLNGTITVKPVKNLSLKAMGSTSKWDQQSGYAEDFQHISTLKNNVHGYASRGESSHTNSQFEFTAKYANDIGPHSFNVLGGYSYQRYIQQAFSLSNSDFPTDVFTYNRIQSGNYLSQGKASMSSSKSSYKLIGFFGRLNYNYDNRYILMGSVRYEGNSKFGAHHKWGWFPALSAGWRISEEDFMNNVDFVNNLKLRIGYGVTGIAPSDAYRSLASYGLGGKFYHNGQWVQSFVPARNANPNLKWERKEETNLGLDFSLFQSRLSGSVDLYKRKTKDLLFNYTVPSPPYLYDSILANVGTMSNKGIEASLQYDVFQQKDLTWTTQVNYSTNKNKLVSLSNDQFQSKNNYIDAGYIGESVQLPTHRVYVGGPVGNFYGYKSIGISSDGSWIVEGKNGKPLKYPDETSLTDRQVIGNGIPNHNVSWNNTVRYKNFDLSVLIRGAFDFQILNYTRLFYTNPNYTQYNLLPSAFDKVYGKRQLDSEWAYMSYYVENGDYVKIDNVTLGYTFRVDKLKYVRNARIYVSGKNLYTFTGYSGIDPEVRVSGLNPGDDPRDKYPTTRTFTIGLNLKF